MAGSIDSRPPPPDVVRPVYQTKFGYDAGSCLLACMASIFEVAEADLRLYGFEPLCHDDMRKWTELVHPELEFHELDLGYDFEEFEAAPEWGGEPTRWTHKTRETWEPPPAEFWIASIWSHALKRPPTDPYYPMSALHAVVMQGDKLVHDPNPKYQGKDITQVVMQSWWEPRAA